MLGIGLGIPQLSLRMGGFSPASLFAASEPGVWLAPSDLSTLFQDDAGTTPVTAAGQSVGRILDKSGRGNHATQSIFASRPLYQVDSGGRGYLSFDGVDDFLVTPTITPGTDKVQLFAGLRKLSDAAYGCFAELSANVDANAGGFAVFGANTLGMYYQTGATLNRTFGSSTANVIAAPATYVSASLFDRAKTDVSEIQYRHNGNAASSAGLGVAGTSAVGNFGNYPLYIGRRGGTTLPFNGRLYGLQVRFGPNLTADQIAQAERWMNSKTGAY